MSNKDNPVTAPKPTALPNHPASHPSVAAGATPYVAPKPLESSTPKKDEGQHKPGESPKMGEKPPMGTTKK